MSEELKNALAKLKADDIEMDPLGRVIIKNPDIANAIRGLGSSDPRLAAGVDNWGCCKNGIACSGKARAVDLLDLNEL
jgi:hypothetical protein